MGGGGISLCEVTEGYVREICDLAVSPSQQAFAAPNGTSIAQAHFSDKAWFRDIYEGDNPVGFLMLEENLEEPEYYLWRFMIEARYQGNQFGCRAMELLIALVADRPNAKELLTSVVQKPGGPQEFYEMLGFRLTGDYEDGKAMMNLPREWVVEAQVDCGKVDFVVN